MRNSSQKIEEDCALDIGDDAEAEEEYFYPVALPDDGRDPFCRMIRQRQP
jgi:hypothetical protein